MKKIFAAMTAVLILVSQIPAIAQHARFATQGTIEFEKNINMFAQVQTLLDKSNESYMVQAIDQYKRTQPQFMVQKSTLAFTQNKTLFTPIPPENEPRTFFSDLPITKQPNSVYTDLDAGKSITRKEVFEEIFIVNDSTRKINWKITSEKRDIAGYSCRRANAIIMDSIYVVAFYTDEIPVSGGPESFTGLPGMILGVALPHEHITWFAKIVHDKPVATNTVIAPSKGKPIDRKGLMTTVISALSRWSPSYQRVYLKSLLL